MAGWADSLGLDAILTADRLLSLLRAVVILVGGFILARLVSRVVGRVTRPRASQQESMIVRRLVFYGIFGLVVASAMHQLGFKLGVLLGAAGILTVAIGFASQTSASNLISGLFLIAERPFVVGDVVTIGTTTGEVLSVDLLSVKLRTFDNLLVRIPNETLIKTELRNLTRFPIRRVDTMLSISYREDLRRVEDILFAVAERHPFALEEPKPLLVVNGFGDSGINLQFSVWGRRQNFLAIKNEIARDVKEAFDDAGIEIPFPQRSLHVGSTTAPFPVRIVDVDASNAASPQAEGGEGSREPRPSGLSEGDDAPVT
jgi:small-conductance mechanosensitive channel